LINIIYPSQFKSIPWKNGLGETIELAINDGGTLDNFDWRLSIASVVSDGQFSDFSGYHRDLILLSGKGINLQHHGNKTDKLNELLAVASFDGGYKTTGKLISGSIKDFNVIVNKSKFRTRIRTYPTLQSVVLSPSDYCFAFCTSRIIVMTNNTGEKLQILNGNLLMISHLESVQSNAHVLTGENMIVIYLYVL